MLIIRRPGWYLPEKLATPEHLVLGRRAGLGLAGAALAMPAMAQPAATAGLQPLPAMRNARYAPGRALTAERDALTFNNFYEFGSHKNIWQAAQRLPLRPWQVRIEGMVATPRTWDVDELIRAVSLEERVYRLRCVEAWAMTVPWTGFPMSELLRLAEPQASAKYVVFETAQDRQSMIGLRQTWYPWPYIEGCTTDEAANELSFMAVGMYGKTLSPQNGGPIRMVLPWKYGFKSGKSVVRITFTDRRPVCFWERIQGEEYGFWANVNPAVPHPRWSQASERLLGSNERVPTQMWNGYGEFVAALYADRQNETLFR